MYPTSWALEEQVEPDQVCITLTPTPTSFVSIWLFTDRSDPKEYVEATLDVFRDEYTELDIYPVKASVGRRPALAREVEFMSMDMMHTAMVRSFRGPLFTFLVLFQVPDYEYDLVCPKFKKIVGTVRCIVDSNPIDPDFDEEDSDEEHSNEHNTLPNNRAHCGPGCEHDHDHHDHDHAHHD